jgi:hypothetical protein
MVQLTVSPATARLTVICRKRERSFPRLCAHRKVFKPDVIKRILFRHYHCVTVQEPRMYYRRSELLHHNARGYHFSYWLEITA